MRHKRTKHIKTDEAFAAPYLYEYHLHKREATGKEVSGCVVETEVSTRVHTSVCRRSRLGSAMSSGKQVL